MSDKDKRLNEFAIRILSADDAWVNINDVEWISAETDLRQEIQEKSLPSIHVEFLQAVQSIDPSEITFLQALALLDIIDSKYLSDENQKASRDKLKNFADDIYVPPEVKIYSLRHSSSWRPVRYYIKDFFEDFQDHHEWIKLETDKDIEVIKREKTTNIFAAS